MTLRKSIGNMYEFVTHTFNIIKGECPHDCKYCYMKIFEPLGKLRFDIKQLKVDLGKGNFIFVGSSCDMFAKGVTNDWIEQTLKYCSGFDNKYLFQSKDPKRIYNFKHLLPKESVIGTTIETNRKFKSMGRTPSVEDRAKYIGELSKEFETMVTIEPIMDFDLSRLIEIIKIAKPNWVNIGADSKSHNLQEPTIDKIMKLVTELNKFTEVRKKINLQRLIDKE